MTQTQMEKGRLPEPQSKENDKEKKGSWKGWLTKLSVAIPVVCYFFGRAYDTGFATRLGIRQALSPLSWAEYIHTGVHDAFPSFVVHAGQSLDWWGIMWESIVQGCAYAAVIVLFLLVRAKTPKFGRLATPLVWLSGRSKGFYLSLLPFAVMLLPWLVGFAAVLVAYYVTAPAMLAEWAANLDAQRILEQLHNEDAWRHFPSATFKVDDKTVGPMLVVQSRGDLYVVFDGNQCRVEQKSNLVEIVGAGKKPSQGGGQGTAPAPASASPASNAAVSRSSMERS